MRKRRSMARGKSKRLFTRTAMKTNPRNMQMNPMRGGIRL